jgi:putative RNA 2'-phosphotransferase
MATDPIEISNLSKFLSYVLRHHPGAVGITLDEQGWVEVEALVTAIHHSGREISLEQLQQVVFSSEKQRFAFSADGKKIRANQGHSVAIDLALEPQLPPQILFHGTATRFLDQIMTEGLKKMQRHHVHLSPNRDIAQAVGQRHGKVVILGVAARTMHTAGYEFFLSQNGVWLTESVPPEFMSVVP